MFAPINKWKSPAMARFALHDYSNKQLLSTFDNKHAFEAMETAILGAVNLFRRLQNKWAEDHDGWAWQDFYPLVLNQEQLNNTVHTARATMNLAEIGEIAILQCERSTTVPKPTSRVIFSASRYWLAKLRRKKKAGRVVGDKYFNMQTDQGRWAYQRKLSARLEGGEALGQPAQISQRAKRAVARARRAAKRERRAEARDAGKTESEVADQQPAQLRGLRCQQCGRAKKEREAKEATKDEEEGRDR